MKLLDRKALSWLGLTMGMALGACVILAALSIWKLGSISAGFAYASGDRLIVDERTKSFGVIEEGRNTVVSFALKNPTARPVRVYGAESSCTCTEAKGLPLTIQPSETGSLTVVVHTRTKTDNIRKSVLLFTSEADQPEVWLGVTGTVVGAVPKPGRRDPGSLHAGERSS